MRKKRKTKKPDKRSGWPPRIRIPKGTQIRWEDREPDKNKEVGGRVDVPVNPCEDDE